MQDFSQILPLLQQLWPRTDLDVPAIKACWQKTMKSASFCYLVAIADRRVAGFVSIALSFNLWRAARVATINELVVNAGDRRSGIGKMLMSEAERYALSLGCVATELDSAPHRVQAHAFYRALGYQNRAFRFAKELKTESEPPDAPQPDSLRCVPPSSRHFKEVTNGMEHAQAMG